jgi:hypothetical protein
MNKTLLLLIFIIIPNGLFAQMIEDIYTSLYFGGTPEAELRTQGIGSLGFGSYGARYNPHYIQEYSGLNITFGGLLNTKQTAVENGYDIYKNNSGIKPVIDLSYGNSNITLQLSYNYSLLSNKSPSGGSTTYNFPAKDHNVYIVRSNNIEYQLENESARLSASGMIGQNISLGIAVEFNRTKDIVNFNTTTSPYTIQTSLLTNPQFVLALNYYDDYLQSYILFKTQRPEIRIDPDFTIYGNSILSNGSTISYPGLLGYGIRYSFSSWLHCSIEMAHTFLVADTTYLDDFYRKIKHHDVIWNNEIAIGMSVEPFENCSLGFLYNPYLKYDKIDYPPFLVTGTPNQVSSIHRFIISGSYQYRFIRFCTWYQYGSMKGPDYDITNSFLMATISLNVL